MGKQGKRKGKSADDELTHEMVNQLAVGARSPCPSDRAPVTRKARLGL
jgi:hypothetical protein